MILLIYNFAYKETSSIEVIFKLRLSYGTKNLKTKKSKPCKRNELVRLIYILYAKTEKYGSLYRLSLLASTFKIEICLNTLRFL